MNIRQISNLKKIRQEALENIEQIEAMTALQGERVAYQVVLENEERAQFRVEVLSPLAEQGFQVSVSKQRTVLWVRIDAREDLATGSYPKTDAFLEELRAEFLGRLENC